jgi:hypothetical protein
MAGSPGTWQGEGWPSCHCQTSQHVGSVKHITSNCSMRSLHRLALLWCVEDCPGLVHGDALRSRLETLHTVFTAAVDSLLDGEYAALLTASCGVLWKDGLPRRWHCELWLAVVEGDLVGRSGISWPLPPHRRDAPPPRDAVAGESPWQREPWTSLVP